MPAQVSVSTSGFLPQNISLPANNALHSGQGPIIELRSGLTVLVGPNAAGKTSNLRSLCDYLRGAGHPVSGKHAVYLAAGRGSAFEDFRSSSNGPNSRQSQPAAIGNSTWAPQWWQIEGSPGLYMRLKDRPDLLLKVEARLQALHERRLRLDWGQRGLEVRFSPMSGGAPYLANAEASGLLQLIPLIAALYDDEIYALLIDEPEISLHPQLQAFLLQEISRVAGDPKENATRKIVVIATHSPSMLPLRHISDIRNFVFYTDRSRLPIQVPVDAGELKNRKLASLVARLSENHKLAFFARNVLLVEGPSDEIIVGGLSHRLDHSLLGANTQVVPVTGKGQFPETIKLFRLMGKQAFVIADLDALVDDNKLVLMFQDQAQTAANKLASASLADLDRNVRDSLYRLVDAAWSDIEGMAANHRYWTKPREPGPDEETKAKRRSALAAILTHDAAALTKLSRGSEWVALRMRYTTLLDVLSDAGCIFLRKGTIEDYYSNPTSPASMGKPDAAVTEVDHIAAEAEGDTRSRYANIVRALDVAAPKRVINENDLLREQLGSLLGAAFQVVKQDMTDSELNARACANFTSEKPIFEFSNKTAVGTKPPQLCRIEVRIKSNLFTRSGFPFEISSGDNLTAMILEKLP